ncbi:hypothetical protein [Nocardia sp. alder85J]|uniref:hypothetical protein n=1 Tax=Nocardia sp. alder85J TaxID=2862949 RepID=UPI001CD52947|nr:hypothetical protein [Nocardia sp. alder85J]MCX4097608.1 hypothetical protein [Nocardia sp. alder85J]
MTSAQPALLDLLHSVGVHHTGPFGDIERRGRKLFLGVITMDHSGTVTVTPHFGVTREQGALLTSAAATVWACGRNVIGPPDAWLYRQGKGWAVRIAICDEPEAVRAEMAITTARECVHLGRGR